MGALQVLCNAAKADKVRLQQLEVQVAQCSHRAEAAEREKLEMQAQLQQVQVRTGLSTLVVIVLQSCSSSTAAHLAHMDTYRTAVGSLGCSPLLQALPWRAASRAPTAPHRSPVLTGQGHRYTLCLLLLLLSLCFTGSMGAAGAAGCKAQSAQGNHTAAMRCKHHLAQSAGASAACSCKLVSPVRMHSIWDTQSSDMLTRRCHDKR